MTPSSQHTRTPSWLGCHVDEVFQGKFWRRSHLVFNVFMTLTNNLQVKGENQGTAASGLGSGNQVSNKFAIPHHIELEPKRLARLCRHIFDGTNAHGRQCERHAKLLGSLGRKNFAVGMLHARKTRGREGHRHALCLSEHGADDPTRAYILRHALTQPDLIEGIFVAPKRRFCPRTRLCIVVEHFRHSALVQSAQIFNAGHNRHDNSVQLPISCPMVASEYQA